MSTTARCGQSPGTAAKVYLLLTVFRSFGILLITFQAKLVVLSLLNVLLVLISLVVSCGSQVLFEFLPMGKRSWSVNMSISGPRLPACSQPKTMAK